MAQSLSTLNQIAAKRLSGKAMSNATLSLASEKFGSTVQTINSTVFGELIPNNPDNTWATHQFLIQSESNSDPGTVMLIEFEVRPDVDSAYDNDTYDDANDDAGENPFGDITEGDSAISYANTYHAYHLRLTGSFETDVAEAYFNNNASTAISHGSAPFQNNYHMSASRGGLQIVPEYASNIAGGSNPYKPVLLSTDGSTIGAASSIDWYLDTYSGILFVQDPTSFDGVDGGGAIDGGGNSSATVPAKVRAFVYVGKMQSAVVSGDVLDLHLSDGVNGFSIDNAASASFVSGSSGAVSVSSSNDGTNTTLTLDLVPSKVSASAVYVYNNENTNGDRAIVFAADVENADRYTQLQTDESVFRFNPGSNGGTITFNATNAVTMDGSQFLPTATTFNLATHANTTTLNIGTAAGTAYFAGSASIAGDLIVQGTTTTLNTTNLLVEDKFVLLNSGTLGSPADEGGIVVQTAANGTGTALFYDDNAGRWIITTKDEVAGTAANVTTDITKGTNTMAAIVTVQVDDNAPDHNPFFNTANFNQGQMYVDKSLTGTSDNNIWIYA